MTLIIVPTRELAEQIYVESRKLCFNTGLETVRIYGGNNRGQQINDLKNGADILIATPGRLIDFLNSDNLISLRNVKYFIIDEADRILDMGFEAQLKEIIFSHDLVKKVNRQNLFFSATFTNEIKEMATSFMNEYYFINISQDQEISGNKNISQEVIRLNDNEKYSKLHEILQNIKGSVLSKFLCNI